MMVSWKHLCDDFNEMFSDVYIIVPISAQEHEYPPSFHRVMEHCHQKSIASPHGISTIQIPWLWRTTNIAGISTIKLGLKDCLIVVFNDFWLMYVSI